jgi:uncharacterized protein YkwD
MVSAGCFAHDCPGENPLGLRLEIVDYLIGGLTRWLYGENLGWGTGSRGTPRAIVDAWMASSGHRDVMLNPSFRDAGVGYAIGDPTGGNLDAGVYTLNVATRSG